MKLKNVILLFAMMLGASFAKAQMPQLPVDAQVKIGKLENGLTYYIRHNEEPKNQAAFYIVHKVGSVQEDDNQRGLAHFLEHMAFNGSKHFPAGDVFPFLQRAGVSAYNAETGVDQTYYHLDNVPTTNKAVVDSCLMLLSDWSCGVELTQEEIDKERDVIHGEYRMRDNAVQRIYTRQLGTLYPGSKYADRMPIGLMEVIDNFSPKFLEDYYRKWYHPDIQAVVIVGDIEPDYIEGKIKEYFSDLKNPENETPYELYPVPDNENAIIAIDKDPEQQMVNISVFFKQEVFPYEMRNSVGYYVQDYVKGAVVSSLNQRLQELAMKAECPFTMASVNYGNYLVSKTCDAFSMEIMPKDGCDLEAVQCVMAEVSRMRQHGITAAELSRYAENVSSYMENIYNNRNKQPNEYFAQQYRKNFVEGEPIPGIEVEYELMKSIGSQIPAEVYNEFVKECTESIEKNLVVLAMYPEKEGVRVPSAEEMKAAIAAGHSAQMEAYVDEVNDAPMIDVMPKPVKIKKQEQADFGFTKWTLGNGANVYFKKTDFSDNTITMKAVSKGGTNKLSAEDAPVFAGFYNPNSGVTIPFFDIAMSSTGLGNMTEIELAKKLTGKKAAVNPTMDDKSESLKGASTVKDLRTLFELTYLRFQEPSNDVDGYNNIIGQLNMVLPQLDAMHDVIQKDSCDNTVYNHNPYHQLIHASTLLKLDYERVRQIYRERYQNAGDFDFYFSGPINEDSLRLYVEQYIAPLKAQKKREDYAEKSLGLFNGHVENNYTCPMPNADATEAQVNVTWMAEIPYTLKNEVTVSALGTILSERYFKKIREEGSMGYFAGASGRLSLSSRPNVAIVKGAASVKPEMKDAALKIILEEMEEVAKNGVTDEELKKYREPALTSLHEMMNTDDAWITFLETKNNLGEDVLTGREEAINAVSSDDIKAIVNNYILKQDNRAIITMMPE